MCNNCIKTILSKDFWITIGILSGFSALAIAIVYFVAWMGWF